MSVSPEGKNFSNLSHSEQLSLKQLKCDRNIVIKEADKGSAAVVWDRGDYISDGLGLFCIEIKPVNASPFIIIAWYRPPSDPISTFDKLEKVLQYLENDNKEIILIGDTNCNLLHQEDLQSSYSDLATAFGSMGTACTADANTGSGMCKHMIDLYKAYGLKQLIK